MAVSWLRAVRIFQILCSESSALQLAQATKVPSLCVAVNDTPSHRHSRPGEGPAMVVLIRVLFKNTLNNGENP